EGALGDAQGSAILIDADAAGHGWFVDATPKDSSEFSIRLDRNIAAAAIGSDAYSRMDLLSVLAHEIGHVLGFGHEDAGRMAVMGDDLEPGVRFLLEANTPAVADIPGKARGESADRSAAVAWLADMATYWQLSHDNARFDDQTGAGARSDWLVGGGADDDMLKKSPAGSNASIDWSSAGFGSLGTDLSPYAPLKSAKYAASNLADFAVKFDKVKGQEARFDSLGRALLGEKGKSTR
ncbi:MAG: hypothetical protein OEZ09_10740, partial [Betaproteobacteria bacterium]|nr:hypothetical protein [Betaproteobacteria bacterium]